MVKYTAFDPPNPRFPYRIKRRINVLSTPRRDVGRAEDNGPVTTPGGVRVSALRGQVTDRVAEAAWPSVRRFLWLKRMYRNRFSNERIERIDRMLEAANGTIYAKLANCVLDLKRDTHREVKKKKGWSETDWKKHMDYINQISGPKPSFEPPHLERGPSKPVSELMPRIKQLTTLPEFKIYRRLSQEDWYRDPVKVPPNALKYVISDRVKKLATPRVLPPSDS